MTEADVEKIIKSNMILQMNLAGIRAEFEEKLQRDQVLEEAAKLCEDHPTWTGRMCAQTIRGMKK